MNCHECVYSGFLGFLWIPLDSLDSFSFVIRPSSFVNAMSCALDENVLQCWLPHGNGLDLARERLHQLRYEFVPFPAFDPNASVEYRGRDPETISNLAGQRLRIPHPDGDDVTADL